MKKRAKTFDYILAVIFVFLVIITIYPFLNVLAISFNDSTDTIKNVNFVIPRKFTLTNYKYVFKDGGIVKHVLVQAEDHKADHSHRVRVICLRKICLQLLVKGCESMGGQVFF